MPELLLVFEVGWPELGLGRKGKMPAEMAFTGEGCWMQDSICCCKRFDRFLNFFLAFLLALWDEATLSGGISSKYYCMAAVDIASIISVSMILLSCQTA